MTEWLNSLVGEEYAPYAAVAIGLFVILILISVFFRILRAFRGGTFGGRNMARLGIVEATVLEEKRRLVLIRRDNVEHLILIGGPTDIVIEQGIQPFSARQSANETRIAAASAKPRASTPASNLEAAPTPASAALSTPQSAQTQTPMRSHPTATTHSQPVSPQPSPAAQTATASTNAPLVQNPAAKHNNQTAPANDSARKDQDMNRLIDQIAGD